MDKGEIYFSSFAFADVQRSKARPLCVVSGAAFNAGRDVVVSMITSNQRLLARPGVGDVVVQDWRGAGLWVPSVIRTGRLQTVAKGELFRRVGNLAAEDLHLVDDALRRTLELPVDIPGR